MKQLSLFAAVLAFLMQLATGFAGEVRFSRDVLPILSDRCFHCHGPDEAHREADLRLDVEQAALADRGGYAAIAPGKPADSELLARIVSDDPDLLMPPPDSHRVPLTDEEVEILRTWIAQGAVWGKHWAFEKPTRPQLPDGTAHPVDAFIKRRLDAENLEFSVPAQKKTLLRRVSFDLTGLPPTPAETAAFVADDSPQAFEKAVDRLLASKHYGERMAMWWLDASRYSDTDGYQQDSTRTNWPWRDYVVESFNRNQPFDQFTIEQFAGDLLPDATPEQILATCFHRNHLTNGEGGRDPEQSRIDYVIDRVNTTGTVWLGLTVGCAQCHTHKFDPIAHSDYYSLFAFFNSIDENGKAGRGAKPYLKYESPYVARAIDEAQQVVDQRRGTLDQARSQAEQEFESWLETNVESVSAGFVDWHRVQATALDAVEGSRLKQIETGEIISVGPHPQQDDYRITARPDLPRITGFRLEVLPDEDHTFGKYTHGKDGEFILTDVKLQVRQRGQSQLRDVEFASAIADVEDSVKGRKYGQVKDTLDDDPRNGWTTKSHDSNEPRTAVFALAEPLVLAENEELIFVMLHRSTQGNANIARFRLSATDQPGSAVRSLEPMPLAALAAANVASASDVDAALRKRLFEQFLTDHEVYQSAKAQYDAANRQLAKFKKAAGPLDVMVLSEKPEPRTTYILERGVWDKHGAEVSTAVPAAVLEWPAEQTQTRLDLANWLVSIDNPLTARVIVNQLWQNCFGSGLVRTPEDFGLQGEFPTHPDLLDWLAVEFVESGWDVKHLLKLIVTSQTYQQQSHVSAALLERDPDNRLLARGARFRLPSWMIRDAALRSSGLLNDAIGGPPVMPYQPPGVWKEMFMGRFTYEPSQGPAQYRRTLYAFWRRSSAPTFLFDSAQRRVCETRPRLTNTPLQALTLLNDLTILEASVHLAQTALQQKETSQDRLAFVFERITSRLPTQSEQAVLAREWQRAKTHYDLQPLQAVQLTDIGQPERAAATSDSPADMAALQVVASMIFNLDEAISHE